MQEWISVKDRLPDKTGYYLSYNQKQEFEKMAVRWFCGKFFTNVTHWMPLPEPPKEV